MNDSKEANPNPNPKEAKEKMRDSSEEDLESPQSDNESVMFGQPDFYGGTERVSSPRSSTEAQI